jgi:2-methylcitrate dehydratase PrpD
METEDYELEYLRDQIILEEEKRIEMEADWREAEQYNQQLPARIILEEDMKLLQINKQETIITNSKI